MKPFPGATRRVFLELPAGRLMHLRKTEKKSTGPVTFCGRLGGLPLSWRAAKRHELCSVCARLAGIEEAA